MRILSINPEPIVEIPFLNAGRGPGGFYEDRLPVQEAVVDRLPDGVSSIIATGDLQGRERFQDSPNGRLRLLGEALPSRLAVEVLSSLGLKDNGIGVLLAGDLYTVPALDRRGGSGDVTAVWKAFGDESSWVVGVAGNHDTFGADPNAPPRFSRHLHYLDNDRVNIDGLTIAGLGGIIGNPRRPRRRSEEQYAECLEALLEHETDVLVTHDGPNDPAHGLRGSPIIREVVERLKPSLVVRGHAHWKQPLSQLSGGVQILNVDARVVVLHE
ncbi:MAG: metallophosphoesterase family protein [Planctomycetota bacterium]|jgi:Icc-related predicted phosphoesterase